MAGREDFTADEWETMRRAMMAAGVLVAWADGGADDIAREMFVLQQRLRGATATHASQLIRELTDLRSFQTGVDLGQRVGENEGPRLAAIRAAAAIVDAKAPADAPAFRGFLVELAETVAKSNIEKR